MTIKLTPKAMSEEEISAKIHAQLPKATKPLKVVFLNPPHGLFAGGGNRPMSGMQPLGLAYMAAATSDAGHSVSVSDAYSFGYDESDIREFLKTEQPDVVATTATTPYIYDAWAIHKKKNRGKPHLTGPCKVMASDGRMMYVQTPSGKCIHVHGGQVRRRRNDTDQMKVIPFGEERWEVVEPEASDEPLQSIEVSDDESDGGGEHPEELVVPMSRQHLLLR